MADYLTLAEVEAIHADQIERYGGAPGLRDEGQLVAALFRPQSGYYADVVAEAAALWESLSQNHPFIDGNKRTGFMAAYMFLGRNGLALVADEVSATTMTQALAASEIKEDEYATWLGQNTIASKKDDR